MPVAEKPHIESILDKRIGKKTRRNEHFEYLVKWKGHPFVASMQLTYAFSTEPLTVHHLFLLLQLCMGTNLRHWISEKFQSHLVIQSHKHFLQFSSRPFMAQVSSYSTCCMFLSETFPSSNVPEPDYQPQTEVVSDVDLLYACTPDLTSIVAPSLGCEVPSSLQRIVLH